MINTSSLGAKDSPVNFAQKRTKIIATLGPSSESYELVREMIKSGVTVIRVNFSHGSHEEQRRKMVIARQLSEELNIPISILLDTKGPEIRIGKMRDGGVEVLEGSQIVVLTNQEDYQNTIGDANTITISYQVDKDVQIGDSILIDDGKLNTVVERVEEGRVVIRCINSHYLRSNKRVNIPGATLSLPFLSERDIDDVIFGVENDIDYVAASFVNTADDVRQLRALLDKHNATRVQIIAKIESLVGVQNIDEIIEVSDGIMVARGDLGLEVPYQDVPYYQKLIIRKCREVGKPVIVATQMLDSMEHTPHPTRAEVTDVYFATELGADATMLSGESAQGRFPLEAVRTMAIINRRAEMEFNKKYYYVHNLEKIWASSAKDERDRIAYNTALKTADGDYRYVIVLSNSTRLLKRIAQYRPNALIIGIVNNPMLINSFGVTSSVFISRDSIEYYRLGKEDHGHLHEVLVPFYPQKGEKYLVVENEKTSEYTY